MSLYRNLLDLYEQGQNISSYLKENPNLLASHGLTASDSIAISYDLQAGSYVHEYFSDYKKYSNLTSHIIGLLEYIGFFASLFLASGPLTFCDLGTGEATRYVPILNSIPAGLSRRIKAYGIDLSLSRLYVAKHFGALVGCQLEPFFLTGDITQLPLSDDSCDVLFAMHALEPNGGSETTIIKELIRVSRKFIVLLEPIYETSTPEQRRRMEKYGYITELKTLLLGNPQLELIHESQIPASLCANELNLSSLLVLKKVSSDTHIEDPVSFFQCPLSKSPLHRQSGYWISRDGLVYPEIEGIPLLRPTSALPFYAKAKQVTF